MSFSSERLSCFLSKPFGETEIVLLNSLVLAKHSIVLLLKQKNRRNTTVLNFYSKTTSKRQTLKKSLILGLDRFQRKNTTEPTEEGIGSTRRWDLPLV